MQMYLTPSLVAQHCCMEADWDPCLQDTKTPLSVNSYEDILFQYLSLLLVLFAFSV